MTDRPGSVSRNLAWAFVALAVSLAGATLFHLQSRSGFVPEDQALDLTRPQDFLLPHSAPVGPSRVGHLRWEGEAPLRLRLPGLASPDRVRLKLLPGCREASIEVRIGGRPVQRLDLAPEWTLYTVVLEPGVAGDVLALAPVDGRAPCPVHLSAIHATSLERQSSDYPRYWVVHVGAGSPPPPEDGAWPWVVGSLLLVGAVAAGRWPRVGLATWLWLTAPGVVLLGLAEWAARASELRFVYPPSSFPALLLLPGLLLLAVRHRRALWRWTRLPVLTAVAALRARPVLVLALVALAGWGWILSGVADARFDGDPRGLVMFGTQFGSADLFPGAPTVGPSGYDGQFYAVLSTDPLLLDPATLTHIDAPSFRARRIFVPFLAWSLALGRPEVAVWTYMGLSWLLALGVVLLVADRLRRDGSSPWWAALLLVNAGIAATMLRVTLDGAAVFFLLLALAAYRRRRPLPATAAAVAATMTREIFLLGALAMAAVEAFHRRWRTAFAYGAVPTTALALWHLRVMAATDVKVRSASLIFSLPFGWVDEQMAYLRELGTFAPEYIRAEVVGLVATALSVVVALALLRHAPRDPAVLILVTFAGLAVFFSGDVYREIFGYARILLPLPVVGLALSGSPDLSPVLRRSLRWMNVVWSAAGILAILAAT